MTATAWLRLCRDLRKRHPRCRGPWGITNAELDRAIAAAERETRHG